MYSSDLFNTIKLLQILTLLGQYEFSTDCNNRVQTIQGDTGGVCFNIYNEKANWFDANTTCANNGGRLAKIFNDFIRFEIRNIIRKNNLTENYWVGLKRDENTQQFQWTDGANIKFDRWRINHPKQGKDCAGVSNGDEWLSLNCTDLYSFICETGKQLEPYIYISILFVRPYIEIGKWMDNILNTRYTLASNSYNR